MSAIAIIPARGGSKRIPRKNIKPFCGKPIIAYSIETALQSNCFDEVMVSTDDKEISEIAKEWGAKVPFYRSSATSNDHAGILEVLVEVIEEYRKIGQEFTYVCCIFPTAPLICKSEIAKGLEILKKDGYDSVFPVVRYSYPILRSLEIKNGKIQMIWPENYSKRSQDLPPAFHDAGQFYWIKPDICFSKRRVFTDNSGAIEIPESSVQDIDTEEDWKICELKFRLSNNVQ